MLKQIFDVWLDVARMVTFGYQHHKHNLPHSTYRFSDAKSDNRREM